MTGSGTATHNEAIAAKENLRAIALKSGAMALGIAPARAFTAAEEGHAPEDLLPGAKSVIVVGGAQPRAGDWQSPNYQHMEVTSTTDRVASVGNKLAQYVEREYGHYALMAPPGVDRGRKPFLSISLAAELAGIGSPSLAGPILHPDYGFMYYSAVITTLDLPGDAAPETPVCPAPTCVEMYEAEGRTPCMAVCPINDGGCIGGTLEDGKIAERQFDVARCTARVQTYWVPGFQKRWK